MAKASWGPKLQPQNTAASEAPSGPLRKERSRNTHNTPLLWGARSFWEERVWRDLRLGVGAEQSPGGLLKEAAQRSALDSALPAPPSPGEPSPGMRREGLLLTFKRQPHL